MEVDLFFQKTPDGKIACGDSGYSVWVEYGRDGSTLLIRHETKQISNDADRHMSILCFCSQSSRPMTFRERWRHKYDLCPDVILWAVSWSGSRNSEEIEGLGNTRQFLERFFRYY